MNMYLHTLHAHLRTLAQASVTTSKYVWWNFEEAAAVPSGGCERGEKWCLILKGLRLLRTRANPQDVLTLKFPCIVTFSFSARQLMMHFAESKAVERQKIEGCAEGGSAVWEISGNISEAAAKLRETLPICQIGLQIHTANWVSVFSWIDISQGDTTEDGKVPHAGVKATWYSCVDWGLIVPSGSHENQWRE